MGREVRRVPADWNHPLMEGPPYSDGTPRYQPMHNRSYAQAKAEWDEDKAKWERGELSFEEWGGDAPNPDFYMPEFPEGSRTHFQMYENTSEGTPISPVMDSPESLARWLADNDASASGGMTATYDQWLRVCLGGYAPSAIANASGVHSGVAGLTD